MPNIEEFDYSLDLTECLLWQYDNAFALQTLINGKQTWYTDNQTEFWTDWYNNVFNLITANLFGLAVWSIILNIPLFVLTVPFDPDAPVWGFNELPFGTTNHYYNFGFGNFSAYGSGTQLTEDQQRLILRLRYFQLTTRADITDINKFLNYLQATSPDITGTWWALDNLNMTMRYVFNFPINRILLSVMQELDILPRPATVGIEYYINTGTVWGFGNLNQNFTNGNFIPTSYFV